MGEIADMIIDGLLDEETGEYVGDINKEIYGTESPGFPVSYSGSKKVKAIGLKDHIRDKH